VLAALPLMGCSGETQTGRAGTDGGPPGSSSSIQALIDALCAGARNCCNQAGYPAEPLADCEAEVMRQIDSLTLVVAGTVLADASKVASCVTAYRAAASTCAYPSSTFDDCQGMFSGTRHDGESCTRSEECVRGAEAVMCLKTSSGTTDPETGICHTLQRGVLGQPCSTSADRNFSGVTYTTPDPSPPLVYCHSADGLYCGYLVTTTERACQEFAAEGAPCADGQVCAPNAFCDATCKARKSLGSPCVARNECAELLACENGTCAPLGVASDKLCSGDFN
jgi:hypothetical protein